MVLEVLTMEDDHLNVPVLAQQQSQAVELRAMLPEVLDHGLVARKPTAGESGSDRQKEYESPTHRSSPSCSSASARRAETRSQALVLQLSMCSTSGDQPGTVRRNRRPRAFT